MAETTTTHMLCPLDNHSQRYLTGNNIKKRMYERFQGHNVFNDAVLELWGRVGGYVIQRANPPRAADTPSCVRRFCHISSQRNALLS